MIKLTLVFCLFVTCFQARIILPNVPDFQNPPVPTEARISAETAEYLATLGAHDPEVRPGLFQGDMAMDDELYDRWRVGLRWDVFPQRMWKNRTVPYVISPLYEATDYVTIYKAIRTINLMTCIRFVPWNGKARDFLLIWPIKYPAGCWSYVGRWGGAQVLSLQAPDDRSPNCLGNEGRAVHEMMHALGIFHEQSRADRDKFVKIHLENIIPEMRPNFDKQSRKNTTYNFEYDYNSIMHYGSDFFAKKRGKPTISPKMKGIKLGQRIAMSKTDCLKLNDLYGCLGDPKFGRKYYNICNYLGM